MFRRHLIVFSLQLASNFHISSVGAFARKLSVLEMQKGRFFFLQSFSCLSNFDYYSSLTMKFMLGDSIIEYDGRLRNLSEVSATQER